MPGLCAKLNEILGGYAVRLKIMLKRDLYATETL